MQQKKSIRPCDGAQFLAGGACRAATSPSAWSGRNGPPRTAVAPLYAALLVAARRVPPHGDEPHTDAARGNREQQRAGSVSGAPAHRELLTPRTGCTRRNTLVRILPIFFSSAG